MTLEDRVWELEHKNTQLLHEKGKLEKQLETKAAAQAISSQKEEVERSLKGENDKLQLEDLTMEENYSQSEAEVEQFQKELGALVEEKEVAAKTFDDDKEKMKMESEYLKRRLEEIHDNKDFMKTENNKLQSEALIVEKKQIMFEAEIKRLKMELGAVTEAKEVAAKAFNAQNEEITKKLEDLKRKLEEIQTNKDLVEGETNELQPEVFATEEKNSLSEAEIKCLKQILEVAMEVKEAAAESFDAEKEEIMKQSNNLKRKIEENQASKDLVESENDKLRSKMVTVKQKHNQFEADNKSLKIELGALKEAKEATAKAFDVEKAGILKELEDPKRKVEEIQAKKDLVERENDKFQLEVLTGEQKQSKSKAKAKSLKVELSALVEAKEATAKAFDVEKAKIMKELEDLKKKKHSMYELEVKRLKLELGALAEAKETAMNSFDTEKIKFIMDVEDLKRKIEEIQVGKEATEEVGRDKDAEADRLRAELMKIGVSLSQMQASYNELDGKNSHLNDEKNSI
ncbi:hypothetical protein OsJ_13751 [Oryza sativa Japonica Group]|uniref:Uncharacterized protein n=1 Tax=Oryza sativa subsp. japonica TaxID=39947 RepID=B9FDL2_ORYSJ|nr:hypothetical protein OsJ_13751 [Oryza sativa Japonica Group]